MKNTLLLLALFCLSKNLFTQTTDPNFNPIYAQKLQASLQTQGTNLGLYGLSAAVFVPGQGQWIGTFGNSVAGQAITPDMRFCIASNSKSFTAVLCLKLQEEGLLSLDDSLGKYLPPFPNLDPKITIRQCLMHQTGLADIYNDASDATYNEFANSPDSIWSPADVMKTMPAPFFDAGESYYYSNSNYILAGMCCAVAANASIGFLLKNRIFDPLSLTKTVYSSDGTNSFFSEPWAHLRTASGGNGLDPNHANGFNSFIQNAGGIWSTAQDEINWYRAIFAGNFLSEASKKDLRGVEPWSSYSLGVRTENQYGATLRYHAGAWGYRSILYFDEKTGITVSVLSNLQGKGMTAVGEKLLETALLQRPKKDLDTRITKIISPQGNVCNPDSIFILIQNNGAQVADLLNIHAEIDGQSAFDGQITIPNFFALQTRKIGFPINPALNLQGFHRLLVNVQIVGIIAHGYLEDDVKYANFYGHSGIGANPNNFALETFENADGDLPSDWLSWQTEDAQDWRTSHFTGEGGALCRKNQNDANENVAFLLDLPSINTTQISASSAFTFDYAYALYAGFPNTDSLEVLVSTDCGEHFSSLWEKGGSELATANPIAASFLPKQNEWETVTLPFNSALLSSENTVFRFRVWNGYGNNIWLDNIGFNIVNETQTPVKQAFTISPNPMNNVANIRFETNLENVNVKLFDVLGRKVWEKNDFSGQELLIERRGLATGVYGLLVEKGGKNLYIGKLEML
jgi:D-alanyl-D-alanine carboxypeptidase